MQEIFCVRMVPSHGVTWVMFPLAPAMSRPLMMKVLYCFSPLLGKLTLPPSSPLLPNLCQASSCEQNFSARWIWIFTCSVEQDTQKQLWEGNSWGVHVQTFCRCMKWMSLLRCLIKLKRTGKKMQSAFLSEFWYLSLREVRPASLISKMCIKAKVMLMSSALVSGTLTEQWQDLLCTNTNSNDCF